MFAWLRSKLANAVPVIGLIVLAATGGSEGGSNGYGHVIECRTFGNPSIECGQGNWVYVGRSHRRGIPIYRRQDG